MLDLQGIQAVHTAWANHNFPDEQPWEVVLGVGEEFGEVCHAFLKRHQGLRGTTEEHSAKLRDGIGDIIFFLMALSQHEGWSLEEIISDTWDHIRQRDWIANNQDGSVSNASIT